MNSTDRRDGSREPLAVESLISADARRLAEALPNVPPIPQSERELSVFLPGLANCNSCRAKLNLDAIDIPQDPPNKRSNKQIDALLSLLDSLNPNEEGGNF